MNPPLQYHVGYFPGLIGRVTELHGQYYGRQWGFDVTFEAQVARELSEFMEQYRMNRDFICTVFAGETVAGSVAVDGSADPDPGARLRWFIVRDENRKMGIGSELIRRSLMFCRAGSFRRLRLWTFQGLAPARRLYEKNGFQLFSENQVTRWGQTILEQGFSYGFNGNE